ncbi:MAG: hypothetical protein N3B21_03805 [Clostridia bacterium]|nr:hypothetical protein [Clostridia bacterium]
MSDDLNKKIKQITDLLGQDSMPDNFKNLLGVLANSMGKEDSSPKANEALPIREEKPNKSELEENIEMVRKISKIMDRVNNSNDPRMSLLNAIRPFLNTSRQKKIGNCIKLLQVSSLVKFMDDHEKSGF